MDDLPLSGSGAGISARAAGQCNRSSGQELAEKGRFSAAQVREAKGRGLSAWSNFKVCVPVKTGFPHEMRRILRWASLGRWRMASGM